MKKLLLLSIYTLFALALSPVTNAQKVNQKMGKPSDEEWAFAKYEKAPDAEAVVLYKSMAATYTLGRSFSTYTGSFETLDVSNVSYLGTNGLSFAGSSVNYDVRLRTKILKDSGKDYANVDLVYYTYVKDEHEACDFLERLKVTIFSKNEKNKIEKKNYSVKNFETEDINDYYRVVHVKLPEAKAGDIIEYQYQISSSRVVFLYDWSFQEDIPVLYSKCDLDIPAMFSFNVNVPIHENIKSNVEKGIVRVESSSIDMQAAKTFPTNHYVIEGHDIDPKGLDPKRSDESVDSAKVKLGRGVISSLTPTIKSNNIKRPVPMPSGRAHLTLCPK